MSHDADKLIRQLSLVAFLMAERRPLTARDVKSNVEGYSEMSDEAFARRFYSDRAELTALGVPLQSQRDEFTGEELYTLRSEHYFLDRLELDDDELESRPRPYWFRRAAHRDRRARAGHGARLLTRARGAAVEDRVRDLEATHRPLRVLEPSSYATGRAGSQPVCAPTGRR